MNQLSEDIAAMAEERKGVEGDASELLEKLRNEIDDLKQQVGRE